MFRKLRKCSGNSLGHWKRPLKTLSQLLDTVRLLKILAGCSVINSQATLQTLRKPSENSLRHRKHHLKAFSELSGHTLEIHQIFPRCSFRNSQATFQTLRKHSRNSLRHWKHSLETLRQLSGHSGNVPETHLDTGNTLWKPSVNSWDTLGLLKILAGCSFRNSQATLQTLRKPSENSLRHQKPCLNGLSEVITEGLHS